MKQNKKEKNIVNKKSEPSIDITFLGYCDKFHYILPHTAPVIHKLAKGRINKRMLREFDTNDGLDGWGFFGGEKGEKIDWEIAIDWVVNKSKKAGMFDENKIKSAGLWDDNGTPILNTGNELLKITLEGGRYSIKKNEYSEIKNTRYVYTACKNKFNNFLTKTSETGNTMLIATENDCRRLLDLFLSLELNNDLEAYFLYGWCLFAPFSSYFNIRPHVWFTGASGTGKTSVIENIIKKIVGDFSFYDSGEATIAGLRRVLSNSGMPAILDEAEPNAKDKDKINGLTNIARNAFNESAGKSTMASSTGEKDTISYSVGQSILFSSIVPYLKGEAMKTRFKVCSLKVGREELQNRIKAVEHAISNGFLENTAIYRARVLNKIYTIKENMSLLRSKIYSVLENQRRTDVYSIIFSVIYSSLYAAGNPVENKEFMYMIEGLLELERQDLLNSSNEVKDDEKLFKYLLTIFIKKDKDDTTLGILLSDTVLPLIKDEDTGYKNIDERSFNLKLKNKSYFVELNDFLCLYGLRVCVPKEYKVNEPYARARLVISPSNDNILKIIKETDYGASYSEVLSRSDAFIGRKNEYIKGFGANNTLQFNLYDIFAKHIVKLKEKEVTSEAGSKIIKWN